MKNAFVCITVLVFAVALVWALFTFDEKSNESQGVYVVIEASPTSSQSSVQKENHEEFGTQSVLPEQLQGNSLIKIDVPEMGESVASAISVSGQAKGQWFFEASAPVTVTNWNGLIIGEGFIEAEGDWMTEEFVPFNGEIVYLQEPDSYSATGTVIFMRANPSGLPENDAAVEITVLLEDNSKFGL